MLADNLKALRTNRRLSIQRISDMLGVKKSTYYTWERGTAEPSVTNLKKLALHHKTTIDALVN